jgi:hypothetical protein
VHPPLLDLTLTTCSISKFSHHKGLFSGSAHRFLFYFEANERKFIAKRGLHTDFGWLWRL